MSELLHRCRAKGTTAEGDHLRHSLSWVVSRRAPLVLYEDRLECGDWTIPYEDVEDAVLVSFWSFPFPGHVLRLRADGRTYQFGLNRSRFWKGELPFPVSRRRGWLGYSFFSAVVRIVLVAAVLYWLWKTFGRAPS